MKCFKVLVLFQGFVLFLFQVCSEKNIFFICQVYLILQWTMTKKLKGLELVGIIIPFPPATLRMFAYSCLGIYIFDKRAVYCQYNEVCFHYSVSRIQSKPFIWNFIVFKILAAFIKHKRDCWRQEVSYRWDNYTCYFTFYL